MSARGPGTALRALETARFALTRDRRAILEFLTATGLHASRIDRVSILIALARVTQYVRGYHDNADLLRVGTEILRRSGAARGAGPTVVEAGAGYGASTAKLSHFVRRAGGRLFVFDSFRGIPPNDEVHENLDGRRVVFRAGAFRGRERAVRRVVERYGCPEVCTFVKGDFADTLPGFDARCDVGLLDVDLLRSTRACVTHLHPRLAPGGVMFSQDGHLKATVELLGDPAFWRDEVGCAPPAVEGLGRSKLLSWRATPHRPRRARQPPEVR
jgi:O-methyltransferase